MTFGTGADGALVFTTSTKSYGNLTESVDYTVSGDTLTLIRSGGVYNFTSIEIGAGTTVDVGGSLTGQVLYLNCTGTATIAGQIDISESTSAGSVEINGVNYSSSVANGGAGGTPKYIRMYHDDTTTYGYYYGGAGGSVTSGYGGGGGGGSAMSGNIFTTTTQGGAGGSSGASPSGGSGADVSASSGSGYSAGSAGSQSAGGGGGASYNSGGIASGGDGSTTHGGAGGNGSNTNREIGDDDDSAAGGGGGAGGSPGSPGMNFIIRADIISFTGTIITSGGNGSAGGNGGAGALLTERFSAPNGATGGGGGGGGGAGNAGSIYFYYLTSITDTGTKTMVGGTGGSAGSAGSDSLHNMGAYSYNYAAEGGSSASAGSNGADGTAYTYQVIIREVSDSFSLGDSITTAHYILHTQSIDDSLSLVDTTFTDAYLILTQNVNDSFTLGDSINTERIWDNELTVSDSFGLNDNETTQMQYYLNLSDSITLGESTDLISVLGKNVSDSFTLVDSVELERVWDNTIEINDSFLLNDGLERTTEWNGEETLNLIETIEHWKITTKNLSGDSAGLVDSISVKWQGNGSGEEGIDTIYVRDGTTWRRFETFTKFRVLKRQNQVSEWDLEVYDITDTEKAYFKEQAEIIFLAGYSLILKGRIQTIEYGSNYVVNARGFGMEAELLDKEFIKGGDKRVQYDNISAQTIAKDLLRSDPDDTGSSYLMATGSDADGIYATDYGQVSIRYEFANRLNALGALANAIGYEWWVSQTYAGGNWDDDTFHLAPLRGGTSSEKTYAITGTGSNAIRTSYEKDITNMANYVSFLGYGDGINQLKVNCYSASTSSATISTDITATDSSIVLSDASNFPASGTVRIMEEQVTYSGISTNTLTGCTRGVNGTEALSHKKGVYVESHYAADSPQTGSSIETYGLFENTQIDRSVLDRETAEVIASKFLLSHATPIERIKVIPQEPLSDVENLDVGDLVTIVDDESSINGDYRIVGIEYVDDYGYLSMVIECANVTLEFIEQMRKEKENQQNLQKYMQGATNIYALTESENCDASNPLNMKFYIPTEAVAINKINLNFTTGTFRAYETGAASGGGTSVTSASGGGTSVTSDNGGGTSVTSASGGGTSVSSAATGTIAFYDTTTDEGHHHTVATALPTPAHTHTVTISSHTHSVTIPSHDHDVDIPNHTHGVTLPNHTHAISYGIYQDSFPTGTPKVAVKVNGTSVSGSPITITNGGTYEVDITDEVAAIGPGNWITLSFTPQDGSDHNRIRVEANAYVQIFINSE